jgi:hypothetical protein
MKVQGSERPVALHPSSRIEKALKLPPRVDSEWDRAFPLSYRGGQLVVEYATVCFRSQEGCGPTVLKFPFREVSPIHASLLHLLTQSRDSNDYG